MGCFSVLWHERAAIEEVIQSIGANLLLRRESGSGSSWVDAGFVMLAVEFFSLDTSFSALLPGLILLYT
jgi:hypothetical protein